MKLTKEDCAILNLLQKDCRMSFTDIAKETNMSIYAVKKRIEEMIANNIFYPRIQLRLRHLGFSNILNIQVKLHQYSKEEHNKFIASLKENPFVSEIFSTTGEWDLLFVVVSKDGKHYDEIKQNIREEHNKIIKDWSEMYTPRAYKFETYDVHKLLQ